MRFARYFVDRPILAAVLSIAIFLAGALAVWKLPISEYPEVVPPSVVVRTLYPGANPKVVAESVVKTLLEAIALVVLVVIIFLQTWRASIIPLIAVPVSIVGTFALMLAFGFSINALSLFGLVLAIGIVVDGWFFRGFNRAFKRSGDAYGTTVGRVLSRKSVTVGIYIFTQISLVVLVGLAAKNAILIVEFARELEHRGRSIAQAAIEASRLRLRPILMTSFAFIMGVVPLATSTGAGAEMRRAIGVAVFSGMLGATLFGLVLTPVFYVLLRSFAERFSRQPAAHGGGAEPVYAARHNDPA